MWRITLPWVSSDEMLLINKNPIFIWAYDNYVSLKHRWIIPKFYLPIKKQDKTFYKSFLYSYCTSIHHIADKLLINRLECNYICHATHYSCLYYGHKNLHTRSSCFQIIFLVRLTHKSQFFSLSTILINRLGFLYTQTID